VSTIEKLLDQIDTDAPVRDVAVGAFWTAVTLDTHPPRCGLASVMSSHAHHHQEPQVPKAGRLLESSARELAAGLASFYWLEAGIGLAAYNALLEVDETSCVEANAEEIILERGAGRRVAIVGHFPFVNRIRSEAELCWVLELSLRPGDDPADRAGQILPQADVVALSGTTFINHSFDGLIRCCRPDAFVIVLGASTPLTPLLFERGVDAIAGTLVVDVEKTVRAVRQGATFRQIPGKKLLTMMKPSEVDDPREHRSAPGGAAAGRN
jgi:uncharacterized protein (DUF4213/DUF364 family)